MDFDQLRISDLRIIQRLPFARSIRELARQQKTDPQNLTRRLKQIEEVLGKKLIDRSSSGISLSAQGEQVADAIDKALGQIEQVQAAQSQAKVRQNLRTCGRGFMVDYFLMRCYADLSSAQPQVQFDCMDLSPELAERSAREGLLDVVLSFGEVLLGENFQKIELRQVDWALVVRPDHPLVQAGATVEKLDPYPVIGFCYIESDRLISRSSPLIAKLGGSRGSGAENSRYAIRMIQSSDAIGYLPNISIEEELASGKLVALSCPTLEEERRTLVLHVNLDTVANSTAKALVRLMQSAAEQTESDKNSTEPRH